jgi:hypothetical protein
VVQGNGVRWSSGVAGTNRLAPLGSRRTAKRGSSGRLATESDLRDEARVLSVNSANQCIYSRFGSMHTLSSKTTMTIATDCSRLCGSNRRCWSSAIQTAGILCTPPLPGTVHCYSANGTPSTIRDLLIACKE